MNLLAQDLQSTDSSYRLIPLTRGQFSKVDAADYEWLMQWKWHAHWDYRAKGFKARRFNRVDGLQSGVYMHRQIVDATTREVEVDHRNHDTLDNQRGNLRKATRTQNNCNQRVRSDNTSGHKGVSWRKRESKWYVQINVGGKRKAIGRFRELGDAISAYDKAASEIHGEFFCKEKVA